MGILKENYSEERITHYPSGIKDGLDMQEQAGVVVYNQSNTRISSSKYH